MFNELNRPVVLPVRSVQKGVVPERGRRKRLALTTDLWTGTTLSCYPASLSI
jgi:hypothetical protein